MGWVVSSTPRPHFTPGKDPVPILQEAGWATGPVWTGGKSRPHRDSIPDRPAHRQSLYRLSYPAHTTRIQLIIKPTNTHANYERGAKIFQRYRCKLKIQGASKITWSKLHTVSPQIGLLVARVQNLVAQATWRQGFEHPWNRVTQGVTQPKGIFSGTTCMTSEWLYGVEGLMDTTISLFHTVSF